MTIKIGIICFDSGGANQIAAYIQQNPAEYIYCLSGPALSIFERQLGITKIVGLTELVENSNFLIAGTGWESDFEWLGMKRMLEAKKKVVAFIDHWTNYEVRFVRNNIIIRPDEIWVSDAKAQALAKAIFRDIPIKLVSNAYIEEISKIRDESTFEDLESRGNLPFRFLYLCQPIQKFESIYGSTVGIDELQAIDIFKKHVSHIARKKLDVRIRPHPSEFGSKYERVAKLAGFHISQNPDLITDLVWANYVIGIDSYAMYVADQIGIKTFTVLNDFRNTTSIPIGNIKHLKELQLECDSAID